MHIRKLVSGRYQCMIRLQGVSTSKTFQNKQSAKIWGQEQELDVTMYEVLKIRNDLISLLNS